MLAVLQKCWSFTGGHKNFLCYFTSNMHVNTTAWPCNGYKNFHAFEGVSWKMFARLMGAMKIFTIMEHFTPPPAVIVDNSMTCLWLSMWGRKSVFKHKAKQNNVNICHEKFILTDNDWYSTESTKNTFHNFYPTIFTRKTMYTWTSMAI